MRCLSLIVVILVLFPCFSIGARDIDEEIEENMLNVAYPNKSDVPMSGKPEDPTTTPAAVEKIDLSFVFRGDHVVTIRSHLQLQHDLLFLHRSRTTDVDMETQRKHLSCAK